MIAVDYVKCCRVWPVATTVLPGKCGLCGERPMTIAEPSEIIAYLEAALIAERTR